MTLDLMDYKFYCINVSSSEQSWQKGVAANFPIAVGAIVTDGLSIEGNYIRPGVIEGDFSIVVTVTAGNNNTSCQIKYDKSAKQWMLNSPEQFNWTLQNKSDNEVNILCSLNNTGQL